MLSGAGQPVPKVRGVGAGAAGVELGASLIDRLQVNAGTVTGLPYRRPAGAAAGRHTACLWPWGGAELS